MMNAAILARRFPLIARPRPACTPLRQRVADLRRRADTAASHQHVDNDTATAATAVFNLAALLASDCQMPDLARSWCHRLARATLQPQLPTARQAMHALEPLINLARLHTRAGNGATSWHLLEHLHHAVHTRTDTIIDDIDVPASSLTITPRDHHELCARMWAVLLADGAHALVTAGRWTDAHQRLTQYHGIGSRMLDGRQIAILAHATTGDTHTALTLLRDTQPGQAWEHAVTDCLSLLCQPHPPTRSDLNAALASYRAIDTTDGLAVFRTRLGLTLIDAAADAQHLVAQALATDLMNLAHTDGYAARDILAHPSSPTLATDQQQTHLRRLVEQCGLDTGSIPGAMLAELTVALDTAEQVIRTHSRQQRETPPNRAPQP